MNKEQIRENIEIFIKKNSNDDGIDLEKIYLGELHYEKSDNIEFDSIENELSGKIAILYIENHNDFETIYIDLFREKIIKSFTYRIGGMLSFAPFIREGLSVRQVIKLSDILNIKRAPFEMLNSMYNQFKDKNLYVQDQINSYKGYK